MSKFSLQGLGTPKSASYDNESAYKEVFITIEQPKLIRNIRV